MSTRGQAPELDFEEVVLMGLGADGGLYLPATWPTWSAEELRALRGRSYQEIAVEVMAPFVAPSLDREELRELVAASYDTFGHPEVTPLVPLGGDLWLLELFHGPTLAFKDVALQLLGRFFDAFLTRRGTRGTVLGATSGDTGSAAIEGCRGLDALDIFILHPHGRTSDVQRRQMTCVHDANVFNLAVRGTFDDCQDLVKVHFRDPVARERYGLMAVNSINWARVLAQIVYYFTAALAAGAPEQVVSFAVPTGNFGDVFAGWCARRMGLPVKTLVVATNRNDILARTLATGEYRMGEVHSTLSPSMDIQISSNFERMLFEAGGRDPEALRAHMAALSSERGFVLSPDELSVMREALAAFTVDDEGTLEVIRRVHAEHGRLLDPHTAIGFAAAEAHAEPGTPMIVLATAHPAKFPDAVERASGVRPPLPEHLTDLLEREERYGVVEPTAAAIGAELARNARRS